MKSDEGDGEDHLSTVRDSRVLVTKNDKEDIKREIQIMQHLSGQPNIVEFKGSYEDKQFVHVCMEPCACGELFDRIIAKCSYSERAASAICRICHFMGVMNRDLKPENFLLSSKDDNALHKATNFGLSVFIEEGKVYCEKMGVPESLQRIVREFAVLLDAYEACTNTSGSTTKEEGISERFMGMKAAMVTNNSCLKSFGGKLGCSVFTNDGFIKSSEAQAELPVDIVASELLRLLGFQDGKTLESSPYDLVFVHVGAGEVNSKNDKAIADDVEYPNALVGAIMNIGKPGTEVSLRLHLSVVMSYGGTSEEDYSNCSFSISKDNNSKLHYMFSSYVVPNFWNELVAAVLFFVVAKEIMGNHGKLSLLGQGHPGDIRILRSTVEFKGYSFGRHISKLLHWLQFLSASACIALSSMKLIKHNYGEKGDTDKRNRHAVLSVFYSMALAEVVLFLMERTYCEYKVIRAYALNRAWLIGFLMDIFGALLMLRALPLAPVSVIQPVSGRHWHYRSWCWREGAGGFCYIGLPSSMVGSCGHHLVCTPEWLAAHLQTSTGKKQELMKYEVVEEIIYGLESGILFGMASVISKMGLGFLEQGFPGILVPICLITSICCSGTCFYYQTWGLKHGRAVVVSTCAVVASIVTGVLAGMLALGERLPSAPTARLALMLGWVFLMVDETGFSPDDWQNLIHSFSHVYQRSCTTISIMAPICYAHLAAAQVGQFTKFGDGAVVFL